MFPQITLSPPQQRAVSRFQEIGVEKLEQIAESALSSNWIDPREFEDAARKILGNDDLAGAVVRTCLVIRSMVGPTASPLQIIDAIQKELEAEQDDIAAGSQVTFSYLRGHLLRLVDSESVKNTCKTLELSYEYANIYQSSLIVTDIRPIYDDDVSRISGSVVSYILRLKYDTAGGVRSVSIAMDDEDVESLRDECGKALKKARLAKTFIESSGSTKAIIAGGAL